ncbi:MULTISPECIES: KxYKxGKxW signal peptide domain-containing protein [Bacillota]|nr:KxYKxGKxW signal peptide domain-containing protein [Limosilactobacillus reuteri]MCC4447978.1 KxYKxGKxW signal peptide domain-containing protein [Limosilactobacillus reuteri]MCC4456593.1 KxYKxGKxW signal peptide domain-containing protein [Limosilactobacillus reuteri]MCC4461012.1 KxYKxGKxW signal peptide domain-containing protein [Limosilactobacillus reuteri]MCC4462860.1 KxYKxGKxW signal peptide domain-containing protein [Limosilactobacillus reuteri]MCC4465163.1 KxYKxGKxW signal peptide domai
MSSKKHFKLYKSGKQWCITAIAYFCGNARISVC